MEFRKPDENDWQWIENEAEPIGGASVVSLGVLHRLRDHEALIAVKEGKRIGFAVYRCEPVRAELIALRALDQWSGTGTGLMNALEEELLAAECHLVILCTTNDNLSALRFYQRRGFHIKAVHAGEFANVLRMKRLDPDAEVIGDYGIRIRDEIVLEKNLV